MSMTEQEIRADEREKIAKDIEGLPGKFAEVQKQDCILVARYIRAETLGGWRAWSGLYEPDADRNLTVEIERRNGDRCINKVRAFDGWLWQAFNRDRDIIRWRFLVAKPKPEPKFYYKTMWPWTFSHTVKVPPPVPMPDIEHLRREFGKYHKSAMAFMAAVEAVAGAEAVLNEAARKGYP